MSVYVTCRLPVCVLRVAYVCVCCLCVICMCVTCARVRRGGEVGWYVPGIGRSSLLPCLLRHWMLNDGFRPDRQQRNKRTCSAVDDDVTLSDSSPTVIFFKYRLIQCPLISCPFYGCHEIIKRSDDNRMLFHHRNKSFTASTWAHFVILAALMSSLCRLMFSFYVSLMSSEFISSNLTSASFY